MSQEYSTVLARMIAAVRRDPAQMRALVYQAARSELRRILSERGEHISLAAASQQITALEAAIEQIESSAPSGNLLDANVSSTAETESVETETSAADPEDSEQLVVREAYTPDLLPPLAYPPMFPEAQWQGSLQTETESSVVGVAKQSKVRTVSWSTFELVIAATLAVAIFSGFQEGGSIVHFLTRHYAALHGNLSGSKNKPQSAEASSRLNDAKSGTESASHSHAESAGLPLPTFFGVYAVAQSRLTDLATLPISVPSPRVEISAMIRTPSAATLPNGRLKFIAFRSDIVDNAPDRATVRVVARVMHALTFDAAGHARRSNVQGFWAVRSKAYEMRVGPMSGHADMVLIQTPDPHFTFPPGRYAWC